MAKVDIQLGRFKNSHIIGKTWKKLLNVYNYHMHLYFKFHRKQSYYAKVMSKKPPIQDQGTRKGQVFLVMTLVEFPLGSYPDLIWCEG